jgi:hypothetical protein
MQNNIEVARGTAMKTAFAESREADASAIFDSGRNFRVNRSLAQNPAFAFALGTWIGDYTACTLASGTSAGNTEEALLVTNLSPAITGTASHRCFARCGA